MIAWCIAALMVGIVLGGFLCYIIAYRPLDRRYEDLVGKLYTMKKQGFVPQFEFDQVVKPDLSKDITEF